MAGTDSDEKAAAPPTPELTTPAASPSAPVALELPLLDLPQAHPCHNCGECCNYVAVEIDNPGGFRDYDNIYWYLTHRGVSVYVDWEGAWFIEFETSCRHITPGRTCGIYEDRPHMCSDFSWDECEKTTQERAWKHRFETPDQFLAWAQERRPRQYQRYLEKRNAMLRERTRTRTASARRRS